MQVFLGLRALAIANEAIAVAGQADEKHYCGNARGAKIATYFCLVVSLALLAFTARVAF